MLIFKALRPADVRSIISIAALKFQRGNSQEFSLFAAFGVRQRNLYDVKSLLCFRPAGVSAI